MQGERFRGPRRALVGLLLVVLTAGPTVVAASASDPGEQLDAARSRVVELAGEIRSAASTADGLRERLASANAHLADAERRSALTLASRITVADALDRARRTYAAAQARLNEAAIDTFVSAPSGPAVLGAILGADSMAEVGDRVAYASAVSEANEALAAETARARATLDARAGMLDELMTDQRALTDELSAARDDVAATLAEQESAVAALNELRDRTIRLVRRLSERARGEDLGTLTAAFQGVDNVAYGRWAELFLRMMGAPTCRSNLVLVVAWQVQEFTQAAWNPLATTHRMEGSTSFNSVGVQNYVSLEQGLQATKETIEHGWDVYGYGPIVQALQRCADPLHAARAIAASSWCPGCLNGMYVVGVVPRVDADLASYAAL
jgi:hypothetical protein